MAAQSGAVITGPRFAAKQQRQAGVFAACLLAWNEQDWTADEIRDVRAGQWHVESYVWRNVPGMTTDRPGRVGGMRWNSKSRLWRPATMAIV